MKKENNNNDYKKYLKSLGDFMAKKGFTVLPLPKVILDNSDQDPILGYTGYFDTEKKGVRLFIKDRKMKDLLRTWAHELIHYKQDKDGIIEKSGYKGDRVGEDKALMRLESEAFLKGNIAFRMWTDYIKDRRKNGDKDL